MPYAGEGEDEKAPSAGAVRRGTVWKGPTRKKSCVPSRGFMCCREPPERRVDWGRGSTGMGRHRGSHCDKLGTGAMPKTGEMRFYELPAYEIFATDRVGAQAARCCTP